jgi:hypothetical protein
MRDLATSVKIVIVPIPDRGDCENRRSRPTSPATIPANTYNGQSADAVPTVAIPNFLVTHEGVSADTVLCKMTKVDVREPRPRLQSPPMPPPRPSSKRECREGACRLPLHAGAEKYYKRSRASSSESLRMNLTAGAVPDSKLARCSLSFLYRGRTWRKPRSGRAPLRSARYDFFTSSRARLMKVQSAAPDHGQEPNSPSTACSAASGDGPMTAGRQRHGAGLLHLPARSSPPSTRSPAW